MTRIIDSYRVRGDEIRIGDIALFTVKIMVTPFGYRIYRCSEGAVDEEGIPQGSRILNEEWVCQALFPTLSVMMEPDRT